MPDAPRLPLYVGVARAQAELAELVATELRPVTGRPIVCLQLHVLVEPDGGAPSAFRGAPVAEPLELVERDQVRALLDTGAIVVLGPGIPVARRGEGLRGVDARRRRLPAPARPRRNLTEIRATGTVRAHR